MFDLHTDCVAKPMRKAADELLTALNSLDLIKTFFFFWECTNVYFLRKFPALKHVLLPANTLLAKVY